MNIITLLLSLVLVLSAPSLSAASLVIKFDAALTKADIYDPKLDQVVTNNFQPPVTGNIQFMFDYDKVTSNNSSGSNQFFIEEGELNLSLPPVRQISGSFLLQASLFQDDGGSNTSFNCCGSPGFGVFIGFKKSETLPQFSSIEDFFRLAMANHYEFEAIIRGEGDIFNTYGTATVSSVSSVPLPVAFWLMLSGLGVLAGIKRKANR